VILETGRGTHRKYLPYAFTEHGAVMAATVLNSPKAVEMSVEVVRVFNRLREFLASIDSSPPSWKSWRRRSRPMTKA